MKARTKVIGEEHGDIVVDSSNSEEEEENQGSTVTPTKQNGLSAAQQELSVKKAKLGVVGGTAGLNDVEQEDYGLAIIHGWIPPHT